MNAVAKADTLRPFDDLLADREFWSAFEVSIAEEMTPLFLHIFIAGWQAAYGLRPKTKAIPGISDRDALDPDFIAEYAQDAILDYTTPFASSFTNTTYEAVRTAVVEARSNGGGVEQVMQRIGPLFGEARAQSVAVTETTRLFGLGAQASYRAQGINAWQWMEVNDPWVCPICSGLSDEVFPIDVAFSPAHPRCRCFAAPFLLEVKKPVPVESLEFPKDGFATIGELESWAARRFPATTIVDLAGVDVRIANPSFRALDALATKYPDVVNRQLSSIMSSDAAKLFGLQPVTPNVYAEVQRGRHIILNTDWYSDYAKFSTQVASDSVYIKNGLLWDPVKSAYTKVTNVPGWHPIGTQGVESVVTHEFGHVIDAYLTDRRLSAYFKHIRVDDAGSAFHAHLLFYEQYMDKNVNKALKNLSGYSVNERSGRGEPFAEAFAQMHSGLPKSQWNATTKALDKYLGTVVDAPIYKKDDFGWIMDVADMAEKERLNNEIYDFYEKAGLKYAPWKTTPLNIVTGRLGEP